MKMRGLVEEHLVASNESIAAQHSENCGGETV